MVPPSPPPPPHDPHDPRRRLAGEFINTCINSILPHIDAHIPYTSEKPAEARSPRLPRERPRAPCGPHAMRVPPPPPSWHDCAPHYPAQRASSPHYPPSRETRTKPPEMAGAALRPQRKASEGPPLTRHESHPGRHEGSCHEGAASLMALTLSLENDTKPTQGMLTRDRRQQSRQKRPEAQRKGQRRPAAHPS